MARPDRQGRAGTTGHTLQGQAVQGQAGLGRPGTSDWAGMKERQSVQAVEGLGQVFYEVVHMLGPDRKPDGALVDALVRQFRFGQL